MIEQLVLFAHFSGPAMNALRNDRGRFLLLGSLGIQTKKFAYPYLSLTFHLSNSPPETFVSHPVFLANTSWPHLQGSPKAFLSNRCVRAGEPWAMNQPSVFTNCSFGPPPASASSILCSMRAGPLVPSHPASLHPK